MELPFELPKKHKPKTKYQWKKIGMIFTPEEFKEIYNKYIYASNCEICNVLFPNTRNRQLDHCHETGKIRNIVCQKCNLQKRDNKSRENNTGEKYISKSKNNNYTQGYGFFIRISRDGKYILCKSRKTLEEAIIVRDTFIRENPDIYS
tara:strand:- start:528 stop:971 length:444 start_codon:yes stop_codon:yes gene_type:complete